MKEIKAYHAYHTSMPNEKQIIAKDLCFEYNQTKPSNTERKKEILNQLFGTSNELVFIQSPFYCDYGFNIHIHGLAIINHNVTMLDTSPIHIHNNAFIGPCCTLACAGHGMHPSQRTVLSSGPITLEEDVWLGANVTVCGNVTIGKGSIIAAGSVVTKDIPSYVVAGGIPCKVIRPITEKDILKKENIY